jgi:EF-P beta-lysylation protein EpmB
MTILTSQTDSVRAESASWQGYLKSAIRDLPTLCQAMNIPPDAEIGAKATSDFPLFVPLPFLGRMKKGDLRDPLLRQVLPLPEEDSPADGFSQDPLDEAGATLQPGLLQKYHGRVLMVTTGACAIHCRYCFRRHFPYSDSPSSGKQWNSAVEQIAADTSIEEVILSGGDPLMLVDQSLENLIGMLTEIKHLKRLRVHTRLPIMIPQRINSQLLKILAGNSLHPIVVIHCNHANELDSEVQSALKTMVDSGVTLLNQTVLLKGINDDSETLVDLSKRLLDCRVLPYYLHQLDPVSGASHFEVPRDVGLKLVAQMRAKLPGYGVPRYVKELPGEPNKTVWA